MARNTHVSGLCSSALSLILALCIASVISGPIYAQNVPGTIIVEPKRIETVRPQFAPGEIIVKYRVKSIKMPAGKFKAMAKEMEIISPSIEKIHKKFKIEKMRKVFRVKEGHRLSETYILDMPSDVDVLKAMEEYKKDPNVEYAEPNYTVKACATPNDYYYHDFRNDDNQWGLFKIKAPQAWDITKGNASDAVAIIDTGVDMTHQDLTSKIWANPGESGGGKETNGIDDDGNGYVDDYRGWNFAYDDNDPSDDYHHGTHCAGIAAAATNNGIGMAGINWYAKIMALKFMDDTGHGYVADGASAIWYAADMGAKVISMSYGSDYYTQTEQNAVNYAYEHGCVLVGAAGNDNWETPLYPAYYTNVIAVAATGTNDAKAHYSNYGTWVDVSAPGGDNPPDPYGMILSTYWVSGYADLYAWAQGTSMATPLVAGAVSLIRARNPDWSPYLVRQALENSCDNIDSLNPGYEGKLGKGRINVYKALASYTEVGTAEFWEWKDVQTGNSVHSGSPEGWQWRTWDSGSGRKIPKGNAPAWSWGNE
jgi:subtilisin family serine protease